MQWFHPISTFSIVIIVVLCIVVDVQCGSGSGGRGRNNRSRRKNGRNSKNRNNGLYAAASSAGSGSYGVGGYGGGGGGSISGGNNGGGGDYTDGQIREDYSGGGSRRGGGTINAAVFSKQSFETKPVETPYETMEPQIIVVEGGDLPVEIIFKSSSSRVKVHQEHQMSGVNMPEYDQYEEEPHRLITEVRKPIIQVF